jgi:hypothetical protein
VSKGDFPVWVIAPVALAGVAWLVVGPLRKANVPTPGPTIEDRAKVIQRFRSKSEVLRAIGGVPTCYPIHNGNEQCDWHERGTTVRAEFSEGKLDEMMVSHSRDYEGNVWTVYAGPKL